MVSDKETASIRRFVSCQLCDDPDLSTLTFGILKRRYLAHVRRDSLSPKAKHFMKRVVKEELMKMQDNEKSGSDLETKKPQNKRKREKESEKVLSGREDGDESRAKKSCGRLSSSTSESEDEENCKTGSEGSDKQEPIKSEEKEIKTTLQKTSGKRKQQIDSDDSTEEKMHESEKEESESNAGDSPKKRVKKKAKSTTNDGKTSEEQKTTKTNEEKETDMAGKSEKSHKSDESSDDGEKDEKVLAEKKNNNSDSDSSSLPSLEDTKHSGKENAKDDKKKKKRVRKKKEGTKKKESTSTPEADNKAVVRLKRFIALCGVRRNYKKLLDGCCSNGAKVAALKKELEDLGVDGQPSIKKCKKVRMEREEAEEIAELDVSNILSAKGRPKRKGVWQEHHKPPSSTYRSTLNSGSDSEQENDTSKGRRRATDWANLKGIISDDADSD